MAPRHKKILKKARKRTVVKTRTIRHRVKLPAPPVEVYYVLTSSRLHSRFTGAPARIPTELGNPMMAYGGYITGKLLGLFPGRGFVQSWRTTEWPVGHEDSRLEIILEESGKGTRLTMIHSRVPFHQAKDYARGWRDYYWKPLLKYLKTRNRSRR
jgi:activator of HSP90 ATPase